MFLSRLIQRIQNFILNKEKFYKTKIKNDKIRKYI
jgi:hypothetical protein